MTLLFLEGWDAISGWGQEFVTAKGVEWLAARQKRKRSSHVKKQHCVDISTSKIEMLSHHLRAPDSELSRRLCWDWCDRFECLLKRLAGSL